jgi:hypothetical protein
MARVQAKCTLAAGGEARASIELRAAVPRELVVEYSAEQQLQRIRVTGPQDPPLFDYAPERVLDRPDRLTLQLPVGRFCLEAETNGGGKAQREFAVTSLAPGQPPVVLVAK